MSAIEQLGGVIKIEKKIKSADEIVFNCCCIKWHRWNEEIMFGLLVDRNVIRKAK